MTAKKRIKDVQAFGKMRGGKNNTILRFIFSIVIAPYQQYSMVNWKLILEYVVSKIFQ